MALKTTLEDTQDRLEALLTYANSVTGAEDASVGDAIETLCMGYGVLSAIYTQTVPVHTDDKLDILKQDLIVKETFSDGTTEEISNYTLSGDLSEAGDTTITVNFGRRKTTFIANVSESIGILYSITVPTIFDGTNSIDTGLYLLDEDKDFSICLDIEILSNSTTGYIFNLNTNYNTSNGLRCYLFASARATFKWCNIGINVTNGVWPGQKAGNIMKLVITHAKGSGAYRFVTYAKNVNGYTENIDNVIQNGIFIENSNNSLIIGIPSNGSFKINSLYIYKGILDADEISEYIAS